MANMIRVFSIHRFSIGSVFWTWSTIQAVLFSPLGKWETTVRCEFTRWKIEMTF
jgi:hypothetical protein